MSENDYRKIFVKKLNYYMSLNNKTQADLIKDLGYSSSTISNWCTGLKIPRMDKIEILANYFKINKSDLLEDKPQPNTDKELKVALFGGDGEVTDEMWQEVKDFAEYVKQKHFKK